LNYHNLPFISYNLVEPINTPAIPVVERPTSTIPVVEFPVVDDELRWVIKKFFPHREPSKHPMKLRGSKVFDE
jgi:hypothetical protein